MSKKIVHSPFLSKKVYKKVCQNNKIGLLWLCEA